MRQLLENPFYYLDNFQQVLAWVGQHHGDLLDDEERAFIDRFGQLPQASRALLVRMVMRKGELFRASKLSYAEIGCPRAAVSPLVALGWVNDDPLLDLTQLFGLLKKDELIQALKVPAASWTRKAELLETMRDQHDSRQPLSHWHAALDDEIFELRINPLCERLRLMFFGNIHQDWSEFVLADLGIYRYEPVPFAPSSRAFASRQDVDAYLRLHRCRERFEAGDVLDELLTEIPTSPYSNQWLENRRGKLLLSIARQYERRGDLQQALQLYTDIRYPGARQRRIRVLELNDQIEAALQLALQAIEAPESEAETQQVERMLPRLRRSLGEKQTRRSPEAEVERIDLCLPQPIMDINVEHLVLEHLTTEDAPVFYVENTLINSLLGLLCWETIFAPLPGAFFHPFHAAPADLARADFYARRAECFEACLQSLMDGSYGERIRRRYREKFGTQCQFVSWGLLDEALLELALNCLPARHLEVCFRRILLDVPNHRTGLPDLIQFWPGERRYRMIEVKGPGDRLQDNQKRWLAYARHHQMPVAVCYVRWAEALQ